LKIELDLSRIEAIARDAQFITAQAIHSQSLDVIRRPGAFPDYPPEDRDIVLTGLLRDMTRPPVRQSPETVAIETDAPYAIYVYLGYGTTTGGEVPPRPWFHKAAEEIGVEETFADSFRGLL